MKKTFLLLLFLPLLTVTGKAQTDNVKTTDSVAVFRFVPQKDMFYIPWNGNDNELQRLYGLVDRYKTEIESGRMPVHVDGYCASFDNHADNFKTAVVRSNRVKSELITEKGLQEEHFVTENHAVAYASPDGRTYKDMVVVTLRIPVKKEEAPRQPEPKPEPVKEPEKQPEPQPVVEQPAQVVTPPTPAYSRWSVGLNAGLPFFWGDFNSLSADKTYIGYMAGVQGSYQLTPLLGVTLSFDYARNKACSRDYAAGYLLGVDGMTYYTPQAGTTENYKDLYSKINMYSAGLHLDINLNRLFGPGIANGKLKVILSPAVCAQHFNSGVYTKRADKLFTDNAEPQSLSLGLGGDVALRYNASSAIDLQLKGTGIWITDNNFDGIATVGYVKQNAMWCVSAGVVWKIGGENLLHKRK